MATEYVLWATRKGDEDWQEELITATPDMQKLEKAKAWAKANGFDRLRVGNFREGEVPDFAGTINQPVKTKRAAQTYDYLVVSIKNRNKWTTVEAKTANQAKSLVAVKFGCPIEDLRAERQGEVVR